MKDHTLEVRTILSIIMTTNKQGKATQHMYVVFFIALVRIYLLLYNNVLI